MREGLHYNCAFRQVLLSLTASHFSFLCTSKFFNCDPPYMELSLQQVLKVGNVKKIYIKMFFSSVCFMLLASTM